MIDLIKLYMQQVGIQPAPLVWFAAVCLAILMAWYVFEFLQLILEGDSAAAVAYLVMVVFTCGLAVAAIIIIKTVWNHV